MKMKKVMIYDSQDRNIVCSKLHSNQQNLTYATVKLRIAFANRVISKHLLNRMHAHERVTALTESSICRVA